MPQQRDPWNDRFDEPRVELRRLLAELLGTLLLVLAATGTSVVGAYTSVEMGRAAEVVAPGLMLMAIILSMGRLSGAHLNPAVTVGFALRQEFPWRRVPGYLVAQLVGATAAVVLLAVVFGRVGGLGATTPGAGVGDGQALVVEIVLTFGLFTVIAGTASSAQNVGPLSALAVGGYLAMAGLWSSPVSGASMNPARSLGPDLVLGDWSAFWIYVVGPLLGAVLAVGCAVLLRGGPDAEGARTAQGQPPRG